MPTLYLTENRSLVRRDSEDCLLVQIPEARDEAGTVIVEATKKRIPLIKVDDVVVLGEVTLTASAVHMLLDKNVEIHFLDQRGIFKGCLSPALSKNSLLRLAQHRAHNQLQQRCELARKCVIGKLANQRTMLLRANRRLQCSDIQLACDQIATSIRQLYDLSFTDLPVPRTLANGDMSMQDTPLERILGLEGAGSAAYFRCFGMLITDQKQWPFAGRVKRPPTDAVNALLSYGYALLTAQVSSAINIVGLDPFVGYLHSSVYGRVALALDLMEEFRPLIVDSTVTTMLNNRMLTPDDFEVELGAYRLKKEPRKLFLTKLEARLNEEITHPVFNYKTKYRQCIELQARLLAKTLTGELTTYQPLIMR